MFNSSHFGSRLGLKMYIFVNMLNKDIFINYIFLLDTKILSVNKDYKC